MDISLSPLVLVVRIFQMVDELVFVVCRTVVVFETVDWIVDDEAIVLCMVMGIIVGDWKFVVFERHFHLSIVEERRQGC